MASKVNIFQGDIPPNLAELICNLDEIACDIETSGLDWRKESIGTFQIYAPVLGVSVVKIASDANTPHGLKEVLECPKVTKVFHHASFDLSFIKSKWNVRVQSVACTKVASKISCPEMPNGGHSLKNLLRTHLGVAIDKTQQQSNWLIEDLSIEQLHYAAEDVLYLLKLRKVLEKAIAERRRSYLYEECLRFLPTRVDLEVGGWPDVFSY